MTPAPSPAATGRPAARRPMLNPGLRRVWRDAGTLQIGTEPDRAVVLTGLDPAATRLVEQLDGTRDASEVQAAAAALGIPPDEADRLLALLDDGGVLVDATGGERALGGLPTAEKDRLQPDVVAASAARSGPGLPASGYAVLGRRRARRVAVHGAGRLGAAVVRLLAAAGVGTLTVTDPSPVRAADLGPAAHHPDFLGAPRQEAVARSARTLAPSSRVLAGTRPAGPAPDLVVVALDGGVPDPALVDALLRSGTAHLFAVVRDASGTVGPLVHPGRTSCTQCHDLHRRDRDPAWPTVAAQLREGGAVGCDVVLATAVAAHTAMQALAHLDGLEDRPDTAAPPATVDGTLEVSLPDGSVRRRTWAVHPACGCQWPGQRSPVIR